MFAAVLMCWRMMWQKILLVMDFSVMPLQLLHSDRFPFFGSLMIVPLFQASGITSLSQTSWSACWRSCGISSSSAICTYAYTLLSPCALQFFSFLIASLASWTGMGPSLMSWSCSPSLMSASVGGSHQLSSCWSVLSISLVLPFVSDGWSFFRFYGEVLDLSSISTLFPCDLADCLQILLICGCLYICRESLYILSFVSYRWCFYLFVFLSVLSDCSLFETRWLGV